MKNKYREARSNVRVNVNIIVMTMPEMRVRQPLKAD